MPWLTVKEAAEMLGCSEKTIRRKIDAGSIESKMEFTGKGKGGYTQYVKIMEDNNTNGHQTDLMDISKINTEQMDIIASNNIQVDTKIEKFAHPDVQKTVQPSLNQMDIEDKTIKNNILTQMNTNGHQTDLMDISKTNTEQMDIIESSDIQVDTNGHQTDLMDISSDTQTDSNWIPVDEAVKLSGISRRTIYNRISSGDFQAVAVADDVSKTKTLVKIDGFSKEVQLRWREIVSSKNNSLITIEKDKKEFELKPADIKEKAWAKFAIVKALREIKEQAKLTQTPLITAQNTFIDQLNHYEVCEQEMRKIGSSVSLKSVLRWDKTLRNNNDPAFPLCLCESKKGAVGRKAAADRLFVNQVRKMAWDFRNLKATDIYRLMERDLMACGAEMPISVRTLSKIVEKARKDELAMAVNRGKKAYKDQIRPHVHRINNAMPGDIYESDGHKLNNLVLSPFYAHNPSFRFLVRPILVVWYDVATGCIVGYSLCIAENPNAVRTSLRMALVEYGIPEMLRMDNGTAYKNVLHCPYEFAGRKGNSTTKVKALDMIGNGDLGLYKNLGINYSFTIPGNSESKMIEPFWGFCLQQFEKAFPVWIGNKIQERHEELRLTNKVLIKKYGDEIPTWEEYERLLSEYIKYWNNSKRPVLRNAIGDMLSPYEAFSQANLNLLSEVDADRLIRDPYPQIATVERGEILVNGIYYSHNMFMALNGRKVKYYYNELNIHELTVASEHGEILYEKAQMVLPGLQVGDDLSALVDAKHREKQGKLAYLAMNDIDDMAGKQRALEDMSGDTLNNQSRLQELRKDNKIKKLEGTRKTKTSDKEERIDKFWELTEEEYQRLIDQKKEDNAREEAEKARRQKEEDELWEADMARIRKEKEQEEAEQPEYTDEEIDLALKKLGIL